jgi:NAD(P)-dependent dehydrogenase (short-subunit alcohol dehydrogenase family)
MPHPVAHRVAGKKALITGAAQGLGEAAARMLALHGAKVFLTDINEERVHETARAIEADFGPGIAFAARQDVTDEAGWADITAKAAAAMGGLSVLVNNAGVGSTGSVEHVDLSEWRRVMSINVDSIFLACKHALPYLRDTQPASIVNISSIAAMVASGEYPAYNASKAAVLMLTKSVALDCTRQKIDVRCNSIHPAYIRTAIVEPYFQMYGEAEALRKLTRPIPMKRLGEVDDVAYAVLYLASDESRFVTASELKVDGGTSAA